MVRARRAREGDQGSQARVGYLKSEVDGQRRQPTAAQSFQPLIGVSDACLCTPRRVIEYHGRVVRPLTERAAEPTVGAVAPRVGRFLIHAALWNVVLFGVIRLPWVDRHIVGALVDVQQFIVRWYAGEPRLAISVNSSCSGADVMALCVAVTFAYAAARGVDAGRASKRVPRGRTSVAPCSLRPDNEAAGAIR